MLLSAPTSSFTVTTCNVTVTSNYTWQTSAEKTPTADGSAGSNVDIYDGWFSFAAQRATSNVPRVVITGGRTDASNVASAYSSVYVVEGRPDARVDAYPLGIVETVYASSTAVDAYFGVSTGALLFTSNYTLPPPAGEAYSASNASMLFSHTLSNVAVHTSNAVWYDYRALAPDHLTSYPDAVDAFVVTSATGGSMDFLHTSRGHGLLGFSFSTADLAASRVYVRPKASTPTMKSVTSLAYANGASNAVTVLALPLLRPPLVHRVALPAVTYDAAGPFPPASLVLAPAALASVSALAGDPTATVHIVPGTASRPGYWASSTTYASPFPDLVATAARPLCYHYGRSGGQAARAHDAHDADALGRRIGGLYAAQSFDAFLVTGTDASGYAATCPFTIDVSFDLRRNLAIPYNAGVTDGLQTVGSNLLSFGVTGVLPSPEGGLRFRSLATGRDVSSFSPAETVLVSVDPPFAVAGAEVHATTAEPAGRLTVRPYYCDESMPPLNPGAELSVAFHHEGPRSSNVCSAQLLSVCLGGAWCCSNVLLPASDAKMVVTAPPQNGFLTDDGVRTVMEIPLSAAYLADLRYVSLSDDDAGSNDAARVRFSRIPGACGAGEYVLSLKHYVYTAAGAYVASNIAPDLAVQFSAGYQADNYPHRVVQNVTLPKISGWASRFSPLAPSLPSRYSFAVDRAGMVSLSSLMSSFKFDAAQSSTVRFVLLKNPAHGLLARFDLASTAFAPVRWFEWGDLIQGCLVYQHDGSTSTSDECTFCVGTHDYDVDASISFVAHFDVAPLPAITTNAVEPVYGAAASAYAMQPSYLASTAANTAVYHVAASTGVSNLPASFSVAGGFPGALSFQKQLAPYFAFQATNSATSNPLIHHPRFAPILTQPHRFVFDVMSSSNVVFGSAESVRRVAYEYPSSLATGFAGRTVALSFALSPTFDVVLPDPAVMATVDANFRFAFDVALKPLGVTLRFAPDRLSVVTAAASNAFALPALIQYDQWTPVSIATGNGVFRVDVGGVTVPTPGVSDVDVSGVTSLELSYDVATNTFPDVSGVVDGIHMTMVKPLATVRVQNVQLNVAAFDEAALVSNDIHNVVVGQNIEVNGVNNIAIGRNFSTSGNGSIVLGTNIGVTVSQSVTSLFECIAIGNNLFSDATVTNVIALGRDIMNDVATSGSLVALNAFLAAGPIVIGNGISASMLPYAVNIGNSFLRGVDGRIYLGALGEQVCVGLDASTAGPAVGSGLAVGGAIQNGVGAVQFPAPAAPGAAFPDAGAGWVAEAGVGAGSAFIVAPSSTYASASVCGVTTATPGTLQASGLTMVWVSDYGGGSNLPIGSLLCSSPRRGFAAAQWSDVVTSKTVGKLLQPFQPETDVAAVDDGGGGRALLMRCLLRLG